MKPEIDDKILNIEIPKSPLTKKVVGFGLLVVFIFFGGFAFWAFLTPLESAAVTEGKVKVAGERTCDSTSRGWNCPSDFCERW